MIHTIIIISGILLLAYALLVLYYHRIWDQIPAPAPDATKSSAVSVSVIIPARNEAARISKCLDALSKQSYPGALTEIIIVNDFSSDETVARVKEHSSKPIILDLSAYISETLNSYKKKAIETGIRHSTGELIICTDADCFMGPDWIRILVTAYQNNNLQFIAAPVKIVSNGSALAIFQILDFISLQGITGAAVSKNLYPMSNGANLAYTRKAYDAVGGFSGIDQIASGDDMLLMKKIQAAFPGQTGYIKDPLAIVCTGPSENIKTFLSQRIRWASKIAHYKHPGNFFHPGAGIFSKCIPDHFISRVFFLWPLALAPDLTGIQNHFRIFFCVQSGHIFSAAVPDEIFSSLSALSHSVYGDCRQFW